MRGMQPYSRKTLGDNKALGLQQIWHVLAPDSTVITK